AVARSKPPLPLKVVGTRIETSQGQRVRLRGVNTASMEWTSNGEGHILETVKTAIRDWHVNVIRLPLAQDRWFGKAAEQNDQGKAYRALVKQVVDLCADHGCYIILDLHWSDTGVWGKQIGQHVMPDKNSLEFWKDLASTYKNHPAVIFDLYNEPHDVTWDVWLKGGQVTEKALRRNPARTYEAVGMQTLLDTVRDTGARNVVIAGGLDWAYDMTGFLKGRQLADPRGNGVIYANHTYPFKGDTVERWIGKMEAATAKLPVIVSEFGSESRGGAGKTGEQWVRQVLQALEDHGWNWTAWDLHPAAGPRLISNWNYSPTPHFGKWVRQALLGTLPRYTPSSAPAAAPKRGATSALGSPAPVGIFENHGGIGEVLHPGAASFSAAGRCYTVSGSGENMWFGRDAFHFVWKRASGDVALTADIAFKGAGANPHRKACLMIRQSLDPDAPYVDIALHGDGLTSLQFRDAKGAATHEIQANVTAPGRLRIEKVGKYTLMFLGSAGERLAYSGAATRIELEEPYYVGIGACSHDKDVTEEVLFSNVELTAPLPAPTPRAVLYSTLETQTLASTDRRVVHVTPGRIEAPNWLKDGQALIYNSGGRIYRIPSTGGEPKVIDAGFATRCNNDHGISPDGTMLAISDQSQGQGRSLIYTLPIGGGTPRQITPRGPSYWHGWSPDGKTLAFCGERDGEFDIYSIPAEGGPEKRLTTTQGLDDGPEFSPDGRFIYFNSVRTGTMQIWRMQTDGGNAEQMTADECNNWFPHLSPDGRFMVFLSYEREVTGHPENKDVSLRRMDLESRQVDVLARLYGGQGTINVPCFSPDGRRIALVSYQRIFVEK
ncbi:MAG: cellulase family glycosylhydrolase, partial [Isosphaeraceae bacterium]